VYRVLEATLPSLRHVNQYVLLLLLLLLLLQHIARVLLQQTNRRPCFNNFSGFLFSGTKFKLAYLTGASILAHNHNLAELFTPFLLLPIHSCYPLLPIGMLLTPIWLGSHSFCVVAPTICNSPLPAFIHHRPWIHSKGISKLIYFNLLLTTCSS